ncbi:MAG: cytochrome c biogenesis protein DipZ [Solirubrobacterales bacterium]|nr:cytochrome c biogenesis protein DipZ [Solirubrobacterales bacterium]
MALLILFGFIAGAATALSPCVLPVLPIALSAGATGGRRRPLGIVIGLTLSFTFVIVALVSVISALGLSENLLRDLAIFFLLTFGVVLMVPPLAARLEAWLSGLVSRTGFAPRSGGEGFSGGLVIGLSLGVVYSPCAGPILAAVVAGAASQGFSTGRLAVALAYAIGSAAVLYLLMLGGRRVLVPLRSRAVGVQVAMGAVMVVVALAMIGEYDIRFETSVQADLPSFLVNPTESLENTSSAQAALTGIRGGSGDRVGAEVARGGEGVGTPASAQNKLHLPVYGVAPEFTETERWFNTPGDKPLTMKGLRGRVVLIDFWTYTCVNCIRTLPYLNAWEQRYAKDGLTIVGVHTPEFSFEHDAGNVEAAISREGIHYPVVQDNEYGTWNAYGNQYWPAEFFVDANGHVRYADFGEGNYGKKEEVIRQLLAEAGKKLPAKAGQVRAVAPSDAPLTPETYLGPERAERFTNSELSPGLNDFTAPSALPLNEYAYHGSWRIALKSATAEGGSLDLHFAARRVYMVLGSPGVDRRVRVKLDGKPISAADAGTDVRNGVVDVTAQRLYNLVNLSKVEDHVLELEPEKGVTGYAFTFG